MLLCKLFDHHGSRMNQARRVPRRRVLQLGAAATALSATARIGWAQAYPARPITLVAPIAAGGGVDTAARIVAEKEQEQLRQSVVVENRPGAGSVVGTGFAG